MSCDDSAVCHDNGLLMVYLQSTAVDIRVAFQAAEKNSPPRRNEQPKGTCGRDVWEGAECQP